MFLFLSLCHPCLSAAPPNIVRLSPLGGIPGQAVTLSFSGENLSGATELWTSFESDPVLERDSAAPTFKLKTPSVPGLAAMRLVTTNGMSSLQLLLVDELPSVAASGTNQASASAQPLSQRSAVDGFCAELRSAFYRVKAKKGQSLQLEVVAQRLGSPLDPLLRVLDASGRELAAVEDSPGLGADARLEFRAPRTGDYFVEVRDTRYAGSPRHRYRLRLGEPLPIPLPFLGSTNLLRFSAAADSLAVTTEQEPNDVTPQKFTAPTELAGRFAKPGDRDVFAFNARKGERLIFSGRTRSIGSPGELLLQIQSTNGNRIAEANPTGADEGALTNRFTEAGVYHLVVDELTQRGGPEFSYRLAVRPWAPSFHLNTEGERFSVPVGNSVEIEVRAERRDYDGPITLKLVGLPESFVVTNAVIPGKATNTTKFSVTVPADLALGEFFEFGLVGSADIDGSNVTARVSTLPALRAVFPEMRHPPAELDGLLSLSVSESRSSTPTPRRKRRN